MHCFYSGAYINFLFKDLKLSKEMLLKYVNLPLSNYLVWYKNKRMKTSLSWYMYNRTGRCCLKIPKYYYYLFIYFFLGVGGETPTSSLPACFNFTLKELK